MTKTITSILIGLTALMLTAKGGVFCNAQTGLTEKYYNLSMQRVVKRAQNMGIPCEYWVRDDGAKMFGRYVMIAANWKIRPLGTIIETSLGWSIVVDTGTFVEGYPYGVDIAVDW